VAINVPGTSFQVSQLNGDALSIVGFAIELSQTEVPYTIVENGPQTTSVTDLFVYGDTVTITGDLVNPGRTIAIYARQVIIGATAFISVSGADPVTSYIAGDPAEQTNPADGAPGANGLGGSLGLTGGTIIVSAESIQSTGPDTGAGTPGRTLCLQQLLPLLAPAAANALPSYQSAVGQPTVALSGFTVPATVTLTITGATVGDVQSSSSISVLPYDPQTGYFTVILGFDSLTFQSTVAYTAFGQSISGPLEATFGMTVSFPVAPPMSSQANGVPTFSVEGLSVTAKTSNTLINDAIESDLTPGMPGALNEALAASLQVAIVAFSAAVTKQALAPQEGSNLSLILSAMGGSGGRGQDGHAGIGGTPGIPGQNISGETSPFAPPPSECVGGNGGPGGQAGSAGTSGTGGSGGSITLNVIESLAVGVSGFVDGGAGGPAASAGAQGPGGTPGTGGSYYTGYLSGPRTPALAPGGTGGSPGAVASFFGAPGASGPAGSASSNGVAFGQSGSFTYAQLAPSLVLYQLLFAQQANKIAYLNAQAAADYQNVITVYIWLQNVTQPFSATPPSNTGLTSTDIATRAALYQSVTLELARLNSSLDYFGDPLNWAPVLTWSALNTFVTQLLALGQDVLTQFENASQPSQQAAAAQTASGQIQASLANIEAYETAVQQQINSLSDQITALEAQLNSQVTTIQNDFSTLQQQYTAQQTNCTFDQVLSALSSIVQLGLSSFLGVGDLTTALAVESAGANMISGAGNLVSQAVPSDSNYTAISAAFQSLQSTLQKYGSNSALIMVADQQFDSMVQQYFGGLPEASMVEDDVNEMINLVQTRNQALLNYTSQFTQLQRLQTQYAQKSAELQNIAALLASEQQPQLPDYLAFLQGSLTEIGNNIVDNLYLANQAFQYWSVESQPFNVAGIDMASLSIAAGALTEDVENYLTGTTGRPFSPFNGMNYFVTAQAQPTAFKRLVDTGILTVQLAMTDPANPFQNFFNVTAETVSVTLPDITPPAGTEPSPTLLNLNITQLGPDVLQSPDGTVMTFTHAPRPIPYEYNYTTADNTVPGTIGDATQGFTGLSPFATWSIDFTPSENSWLDLTQVLSVELTFTGQLLGPNTVK
jgi:hypothetical protein